MATKIIKLPSLSRVVAGSKATLELPLGPTYRRIIFAASGTGLDVTDIGRIDVLIDGKVVHTYKNLQRLFDLNSFYGRSTDTAGEFAIHFFRPELLSAQSTPGGAGVVDMRAAPGIGTKDVQTFHVELDLVAGAPANIAITAYAEVDPTPENLGVFYKVREFPYSSAVSGEVEMDKLPRGAWYSAIHLFKSDVANVIVEADSVKIVDSTKAVLERLAKEANPVKRVPVTASATHLDFVTDGNIGNALRTNQLQDFRLKMTLTTSGAIDIVTETLDTLVGA